MRYEIIFELECKKCKGKTLSHSGFKNNKDDHVVGKCNSCGGTLKKKKRKIITTDNEFKKIINEEEEIYG